MTANSKSSYESAPYSRILKRILLLKAHERRATVHWLIVRRAYLMSRSAATFSGTDKHPQLLAITCRRNLWARLFLTPILKYSCNAVCFGSTQILLTVRLCTRNQALELRTRLRGNSGKYVTPTSKQKLVVAASVTKIPSVSQMASQNFTNIQICDV